MESPVFSALRSSGSGAVRWLFFGLAAISRANSLRLTARLMRDSPSSWSRMSASPMFSTVNGLSSSR